MKCLYAYFLKVYKMRLMFQIHLKALFNKTTKLKRKTVTKFLQPEKKTVRTRPRTYILNFSIYLQAFY